MIDFDDHTIVNAGRFGVNGFFMIFAHPTSETFAQRVGWAKFDLWPMGWWLTICPPLVRQHQRTLQSPLLNTSSLDISPSVPVDKGLASL
jgi:hypothetical protein